MDPQPQTENSKTTEKKLADKWTHAVQNCMWTPKSVLNRKEGRELLNKNREWEWQVCDQAQELIACLGGSDAF